MVFVRYRTADDYVEQILFCRPLTKYTTGEEIYKKVDFFLKNISFCGLTACLLVPMVLQL